ncbi:fatty acid desaturase [Anaerotaenia torta]|uniref:DUF3021 family protein n=1 Tax=Anaerotaenia torta TaxID=433293 RepID=UPI003D229BD8
MKTLKSIIHTFFYVLSGSVLCTAVFMTIFLPKLYFTVEIIWQVIISSAIAASGGLIFYSRKELSKKQMKLRLIINYMYINAVVLGCAFLWEWVNYRRISQVITMILLIAGVYISITAATFNREKKVAEDMNQKLRRVYPEENGRD